MLDQGGNAHGGRGGPQKDHWNAHREAPRPTVVQTTQEDYDAVGAQEAEDRSTSTRFEAG